MKRPIYLVDADGVMVDFLGGSLVTLWDLGIQRTREDVREFDIGAALKLAEFQRLLLEAAWSRPGWCSSLPAYEGAREGVEMLRSIGEVYAVTSPMWSCRTWESERRSWLIEQMGFRAREVISAHAKHLIHGDVLVDDKPEHLEAWKHGRAVCWAQVYNEGYAGLRTNDWQAVADAAVGA